MKTFKIIAAVVLTLALLYVARNNSRGRPEDFRHVENGFSFDYTTVPKGFEDSPVTIPIKIAGPLGDSLQPIFRHTGFGQGADTDPRLYSTTPLTLSDSTSNVYIAQVTAGARGGRFYYYFEIRDRIGGMRARFAQLDGSPFMLKYIGHVSILIIGAHILLMFATVFFIALATINAVSLVTGGNDASSMASNFLLAAAGAFLGGYPFGFAMNWYAFGTIWEGVPFGIDATDNKTQLLFIYLLFMVLISLGSLLKNKKLVDLYPPRALGWFGVGAFVLMLAIYLIPHSIQFSAAVIHSVCYSFFGVIVAFYALGWARLKRKAPQA